MIFRIIGSQDARDISRAELDVLTAVRPALAQRIARCQAWAQTAQAGDCFRGFEFCTVWVVADEDADEDVGKFTGA